MIAVIAIVLYALAGAVCAAIAASVAEEYNLIVAGLTFFLWPLLAVIIVFVVVFALVEDR